VSRKEGRKEGRGQRKEGRKVSRKKGRGGGKCGKGKGSVFDLGHWHAPLDGRNLKISRPGVGVQFKKSINVLIILQFGGALLNRRGYSHSRNDGVATDYLGCLCLESYTCNTVFQPAPCSILCRYNTYSTTM
jgi:hypothetical protein